MVNHYMDGTLNLWGICKNLPVSCSWDWSDCHCCCSRETGDLRPLLPLPLRVQGLHLNCFHRLPPYLQVHEEECIVSGCETPVHFVAWRRWFCFKGGTLYILYVVWRAGFSGEEADADYYQGFMKKMGDSFNTDNVISHCLYSVTTFYALKFWKKLVVVLVNINRYPEIMLNNLSLWFDCITYCFLSLIIQSISSSNLSCSRWKHTRI